MATLKAATGVQAKELCGIALASPSLRTRNGRVSIIATTRGGFQGVRAQAVAPPAVRTSQYTGKERVDILAEALPFIQRFQGKTVVVKYGGAAMKDESLKDGVIKDLVLLSCVGMKCVLVHGGGPEINQWLAKVGIEPHFKNGLRVTDAATMEVVEMVLVGKVSVLCFLSCLMLKPCFRVL